MNTPAAPQSMAPIILAHPAPLLLAIASRCRKGLTTVDDAEALEELARQAEKQIQDQAA
ncbi:hypothetical protein [Bordetella phage vB_BbrM_PHB04]|uniref:Uncharacterized protein n=1 Tax=Bordetella phage vB_BbrM_PHB04 TaxID=2029657 RepID=A0A291LA32_9CAUD|nr:hypothetical protein HOS14_gp036 [Bordetella phage vB_BbrM_PHB04]ATI15654.1 hypothetical protein [Bordetella phage vB_BbrM_PHB04]